MSRGKERNYVDPVAIGDWGINGNRNGQEETAVEKAAIATAVTADSELDVVARTIVSQNEENVKLKFYKNNKLYAIYRSRDYDPSDAKDFLAEVESEFGVSGLDVEFDNPTPVVDEETAQAIVLRVEALGDRTDVTTDVDTYDSSDDDLATVDSSGEVTPVDTGLTYAVAALETSGAFTEGERVAVGDKTYTIVDALPEDKAEATLTVDGVFTGGETVTIGGVTYTFRAALTTDPTTVPYEVLIGGSAAASLDNLKSAVNGSGTEGTNYSTGTVAHPTVEATTNTDTTQLFVARLFGEAANSIPVSTNGANAEWSGDTLEGGVEPGTNVVKGVSAAATLDNLKSAINGTSGEGTVYSSYLEPNEQVYATTNADAKQVVEAIESGLNGNKIVVGTTAANAVWTDNAESDEEEVSTLVGAETDIALIEAEYDLPDGETTILGYGKVRPVVARLLTVTPAAATIPDDGEVQLTVLAQLSTGEVVDVTADAHYESDTEADATVTATGLVEGVSSGSAEISVEYGTAEGSSVITVTGS